MEQGRAGQDAKNYTVDISFSNISLPMSSLQIYAPFLKHTFSCPEFFLFAYKLKDLLND